MNLLFFTHIDGSMIAVNPEAIIMIETGEMYLGGKDYKKDLYTAICTAGSVIRVKESFDSVVQALNAWRKKA